MGKKYYNQYFYTWLKAMDGAAVFASSDSENDKLMLKLCRGASEHDSGEKSHYRLIYDRGLKSFVFLRSVRMDHAIGGSERICNFIHAYQLDGEAESMADYLLPTYFSNGSGEDLCTKSLDKVMLDTSCSSASTCL